MKEIDSSVLSWLLEKENPTVRYYTMKYLLPMKPAKDELLVVKKNIMSSSVIDNILSYQNEDGSWGDPMRFYRNKYKGTVWQLLILASLGADGRDPRIKKSCEFLLAHSQDKQTHGFSTDYSTKLDAGLPRWVIPCLNGNMVWTLIKFGYLEDNRLQRAVDWIVKYQRADDGVDVALTDWQYATHTACYGNHSCHMGVVKSLKALSEIPSKARSKAVQDKITELSEYILVHHIYKRSHNLENSSKPGWLKLGFPLMYQTDILEIIEILLEVRIKDDRMIDAIDIVRGKMKADGRWNLENSYNGKMWVDIEKKGKPSKWITMKALKVLKEYDNM